MRRRKLDTLRQAAAARAQLCTAGLVGPDSTRAYMERVRVEYDALDADVSRNVGKLPADFVNAWRAALKSWQDFYADRIDSITLGWSASDYNETERFEESLRGYRAKYTALSGEKPSTPDPPRVPDAPGLGIPWTGILLVGGVAAAGYLLSNLPGKRR